MVKSEKISFSRDENISGNKKFHEKMGLSKIVTSDITHLAVIIAKDHQGSARIQIRFAAFTKKMISFKDNSAAKNIKFRDHLLLFE